MEKEISYYIKCVATTLILFFEFGSVYGSVDLIVEPDQIYFNYEESNTYDALTLRDDNGVVITESEWDSYYLGRHKFAYTKGQTNRKIKVQFYSNYQGIMHLQIKLSYAPGYSDGIGTICNFFVSNFDNSPSSPGTLILPLTGTLPNSVGTHSFQWKWEIYAIPVNTSGYCAAWKTSFTTHQYFTLLALPQAPMAQPWEGVLDYACVWASGQTAENIVAAKITEGLYDVGDLDGDIDYTLSANYCTNRDNIAMSEFLDDLKNRNNVYVNCTDCANLLYVFVKSVGCSAEIKRIWGGTIVTNNINPIGNSFGWGPIYWGYHQFTWIDNKIYDACLMLYYDEIPTVPSGMIEDDYYSSLINGPAPAYIITFSIPVQNIN